jgi:hypothetical protein
MKGILTASLALFGLALALAPGLPETLEGYQNWTRLNVNRVTDNPSGAHPQSKDIYVNLGADEIDALIHEDGSFQIPFPDGSVLVKERNDVGRLLVDRVYVMEKIEGRWHYSVFDRQEDGGFTGQSLGADNFCQACHAGAQASDFVFTEYERR